MIIRWTPLATNYLLSAQTLLDLCENKPNPAREWATAIDSATLRVSVISIAEAQFFVSTIASIQDRSKIAARLQALLSEIKADGDDPFDFTEQHAAIWQTLIGDESIAGLGMTDQMVYATAMHEGLTVVEERTDFSDALQAMGISIHILPNYI